MANIERGAASIRIELADGNITVYHGTDGNILHEVKNAEEGSWKLLWQSIHAISSVNNRLTDEG